MSSLHRVIQKKSGTLDFCHTSNVCKGRLILSQNFFTGRFSRKFAMQLWWRLPSHLNYVATLHCQIRKLKITVSKWPRRLLTISSSNT